MLLKFIYLFIYIFFFRGRGESNSKGESLNSQSACSLELRKEKLNFRRWKISSADIARDEALET